jgi:hypothetical protein
MTHTSVSEPDPTVYVRIDDIASATDLARMLGVTVAAVSNWQVRNIGFPEPFTTISKDGPPTRGIKRGTRLWRKSEVVAWYANRMDPDFIDTLIRNTVAERAVRTTRKP